MSSRNPLRTGLTGAWESLVDGWQRLYRRAAGAMTRFTPGKGTRADGDESGHELAARSVGWGLLAAELFDDDEKIVVRLEAPGMNDEDFDLQVVNGNLVIRGEKRLERERTEGQYHVNECAYGLFERAIVLPDAVDVGKASARYKNGILRVELPKASDHRRKKIPIEIS